METKDAPEKGEGEKGGDITFVGRVNAEKGEAEFPSTIDTHGKLVVPDHVRGLLGIQKKKAVVQVFIRVEEVQE